MADMQEDAWWSGTNETGPDRAAGCDGLLCPGVGCGLARPAILSFPHSMDIDQGLDTRGLRDRSGSAGCGSVVGLFGGSSAYSAAAAIAAGVTGIWLQIRFMLWPVTPGRRACTGHEHDTRYG